MQWQWDLFHPEKGENKVILKNYNLVLDLADQKYLYQNGRHNNSLDLHT